MLKFVFGALVGAAVALLMAPKSGEEFREDLSNQANERLEQGKSMARKVRGRARQLGDQAQEHIRRVADAAAEMRETAES